MHLKELDKALPVLKRNFEFGEKLRRRTPAVGTLYVNLSRCYRLVGYDEEGLHLALRALMLGEETQSKSLILISLHCLAEFQGQDSIALLQQALSIAQSTQRQMDEAACWLSLGHLHHDATLWSKGIHLLERCGSAAWLVGCNSSKPPMLPLMM